MKNRINIIIVGEAGSGKTTLAAFIATTLREKGFNVLQRDDDIARGSDMPDLQDARLAALPEAAMIDIETVVKPKGSLI